LYFDDREQLELILEKAERYEAPYGKVGRRETSRYYFVDGRLLVTHADKGRDQDEVADHTPRLLEEAELLRVGAHSQDGTISR
jgi:hypothetical protein